MNKNYIFKISKILLFILFCFIILSMLQYYFYEGFRGRGRGRGQRNRRRRIPAAGRGGRPARHLNRFRRRRNNFRRRRWGPSWFPAIPIYYYNYFPTIYSCKEGCSPDGNCVYPGNGPNDCVWATDCWGC